MDKTFFDFMLVIIPTSTSSIAQGQQLIHCSSYDTNTCYDGILNNNLNLNSLWNEYTPRTTSVTPTTKGLTSSYSGSGGVSRVDYSLEYTRPFSTGVGTDPALPESSSFNVFLWAWFGQGRDYTYQYASAQFFTGRAGTVVLA